MNLDRVGPGKKLPEEFNVIIEIPMNSDPVKYEVDEETGALFVDRFVATNMRYPHNYGYIPETIAEDGDCRALGLLNREDEGGGDAKLLAVPIDNLLATNKNVKTADDLNPLVLAQIKHFFEHYKDLEPGKWVKVGAWEGPEAAAKEILAGIERGKAHKSA